MVHRLRTGWLAGSGAVVLLLALSGAALGATLVTDTAPEVVEPVDTTVTFEDLDGDGVDDDCAESVVANPEAAAVAFAAADLDGDGVISVTEAAQSGWTGGLNCNHGGYVSQVATDEDETDDEAEDETEPAAEVECEVVAAPEPDQAFDPSAPYFHGAWVAWVAGSDAVGGKNCNHGGAVSEAAQKDQEAAAAERAAAKAERDAAKAEREAARELRAQEREAAKAARSAEKGRGNNR
jgi:hypothetical protein